MKTFWGDLECSARENDECSADAVIMSSLRTLKQHEACPPDVLSIFHHGDMERSYKMSSPCPTLEHAGNMEFTFKMSLTCYLHVACQAISITCFLFILCYLNVIAKNMVYCFLCLSCGPGRPLPAEEIY